VTVREYVGGHMTYLENSSRRAMKADLVEFYRSALAN
jgi:carboxypeptidase C (cathepsin A)